MSCVVVQGGKVCGLTFTGDIGFIRYFFFAPLETVREFLVHDLWQNLLEHHELKERRSLQHPAPPDSVELSVRPNSSAS